MKIGLKRCLTWGVQNADCKFELILHIQYLA
jgi:hypothetical protein